MMTELTAGPQAATGEDERAGPLRRCIVTRRILPKERLLRFVVGSDGVVVPDLEGRLPGRGLWLQARRDIVETACAKGSFAKAARAPVKVPDGLDRQIEVLLKRRCLDLIGLARRAGQVAAGFEQARGWLRDGRAAMLIAASDGADGGRSRLAALARELPLIALFTAAELGAALGRGPAVHVALARGSLARRLILEAQRLAGFAPEGGLTLPSVAGQA
jgi:uncharacterized protein